MFVISAEIAFNAEHQLSFDNGSKEAVHNHNWVVTAALGRNETDEQGMVFDFEQLKKMLKKIVVEFENGKLEDFAYFKKINASAENVAKYIYEKLKAQLRPIISLEYVEVTESPGCRAKYSER
jgi:6-pyruvoyltetrahydropterin/6-carboxytetrahydropterin synthase